MSNWLLPSSTVNDASSGLKAWNNINNVKEKNGEVATVSLDFEEDSNYIKCTDFGFDIPTSATIIGIQVRVNGQTSSSIIYPLIQLLKEGALVGWALEEEIGTVKEDFVYGSSESLNGWSFDGSLTFTPAEINNSGFGCVLSVGNFYEDEEIQTTSIDSIEINVYYTTLYDIRQF